MRDGRWDRLVSRHVDQLLGRDAPDAAALQRIIDREGPQTLLRALARALSAGTPRPPLWFLVAPAPGADAAAWPLLERVDWRDPDDALRCVDALRTALGGADWAYLGLLVGTLGRGFAGGESPRAWDTFKALAETLAGAVAGLPDSDPVRDRCIRLTTWLHTQPQHLPHPAPEAEELLVRLGLVAPADTLDAAMDNSDHARAGDGISLSKLIVDLGYACCASETNLRHVLSQAGVSADNASTALSDAEIARVLGRMAQSHSGLEDTGALAALASAAGWTDVDVDARPDSWNVECFVGVVKELRPDVNWYAVVRALDYEGFGVGDLQGFEILRKAVTVGSDEPNGRPLTSALEPWQNRGGQISLLRQAVSAPVELFSFSRTGASPVISEAPEQLRYLLDSTWNCRALFAAIVHDSEGNEPAVQNVRETLRLGLGSVPELVAIGLAQVPRPWNQLQEETALAAFSAALDRPGAAFVAKRVFQADSGIFVQSISGYFERDPSSIGKVLDWASEANALPALLESPNKSLALALATLAASRDSINIESWLTDRLRSSGESFGFACLDFLAHAAGQDAQARPMGMSSEIADAFLRALQAAANSSARGIAQRLEEVTAAIAQNPFPSGAVQSVSPDAGHGAPVSPSRTSAADEFQPGQEVTFPQDVEDEANSNYERVYKGDLTVPELIEIMKRYKQSGVAREAQIFACMIHSLFEEYKFFSRYPDKELGITATLFGGLIQEQVVSSTSLGLAMQSVLDALRQPADSKMFRFGLQALQQFRSRLPEFAQFSLQALQTPGLQQANAELFEALRNAAKGATGPSSPTSASLHISTVLPGLANDVAQTGTPKSAQDAPGLFSALKLDTLLEHAESEPYETPPEHVQDKIMFIINNLSYTNADAKVKELREVLKEEYYRWLSNYLVVKRASIEPNFHDLYVNVLDSLNLPAIHRFVLLETFSNIRILLNSEKTLTSSTERSLLKNLGTWLGSITLARNKPIKHKNLAFKDLLLEGYDSNRLIVVIPFVCKVLEQCAGSKVFQPPNPWLIAIMRLLSELYHFAELKLNLKFEVEVLCKRLDIDIKDLEPSSLLKDRHPKVAPADETAQMAKDFERISAGPSPAVPAAGLPMTIPGGLSGAGAGAGALVPQTDKMVDDNVIGYPSLASFLTFNPSIPMFNAQPSLKRIVHIAIERAIREIIGPVVERAVTIASISTREIIIKDFALESNEEKMRKAAHLMVQSLAGSLASVTCKEPLRLSMIAQLRALLAQNGISEQAIPEQAIFLTVADNLELAVSIIEKTAAEKALPEIDEALANAYTNRRKHRERTGQPYFDVAVFTASRYPNTLPDILRLKPTGLSGQQLRVYEDFARISRYVAVPGPQADGADRVPRIAGPASTPGARPEANFYPQQQLIAPPPALPAAQLPPTAPAEDAPIPMQQALDKIGQFLMEMDKVIMQNVATTNTMANSPIEQDLKLYLRQIMLLVQRCIGKDEAALVLSQKVVRLLYRNEASLSREVYVSLLERLCEASQKVSKEVTQWLLYADDERKYNVSLYQIILKTRLLNVAELDMQLARLMEGGRTPVMDFAAKLIKACITDDPPTATQNDFINSIEVLNRLAQRGKTTESLLSLLEEFRKRNPMLTGKDLTVKENGEGVALRDQLQFLFTEWVRLYNHPGSNEKTQAAYILQLQQQGVLKGEDVSSLFFRVCTELSVELYLKHKSVPGAPQYLAYQAVDAFARLIVLFVKYHADGPNVNSNIARINLTTKILSIIVLVLVHVHEQRRTQFNQKPFFRLFSSLLYDLNTFQDSLQPIYFQILSALSNTFHTLQPIFLPAFTFSWLQLVSHRHFMAKLLSQEAQKGWPFFQRLLVDLFKFLGPFLRNDVELKDHVRVLYKGTLRIMLVLLHDFPEFLSGYHFSLTDVIPLSCIQLRNLILSAFPRNMRLPDPFTPNLKVDLLPEINQSPVILSEYTAALMPNNLKGDIDNYLRNRGPVSFLLDLRNNLAANSNAIDPTLAPGKFSFPVINSLVLYVGVMAIAQLQSKTVQGASPITHSAYMDVFQQLIMDLDTEGRYYFLSAIANQLRYPNSHTHYFSCVLLYLFAEANQEVIQEQITRVLLERLIVNRPHPWGLLITFIELIKNPRYNFWKISNVWRSSSRDVERLFESISRLV
ncbi:CCR4-Not complex component, Not1-domain-containing protein [Hyaloraphidium curvatum]|nr:CCR4-Not complex component, Not1-domain-containing protein [Hyaloraphidium curvatum]